MLKKAVILYRPNKMEAETAPKKFAVRFVKRELRRYSWQLPLFWQPVEIGHYWYYDKENYISWDEANISVKDGKVYSTVNPLGRMKSILSVDQKNMFYMLSENHVDPQRISIRFKHRK